MHMPQLPPFRGHLVCFMISASYISSLYLIPKKVRDSPRNDPTHIKHRILAASFATLVSGVVCFFCFKSWNFPPHVSFLEACGFRIDTAAISILRSCFLMAVFYLGPLTTSAIYLHTYHFYGVDGYGRIGQKKDQLQNVSVLTYPKEFCSRYRREYGDLIIVRNLLFAPISEEVAFRALMIPPLCAVLYFHQSTATGLSDIGYCAATQMSPNIPAISAINGTILFSPSFSWMFSSTVTYSNSPWKVVLTCPLWFVFAHVHHCVEKIKNGFTISQALIGTAMQASYTSIFGIIAALLFMRTGNVMAPIISHIICNFTGLPNFGFLQEPGPWGGSEYSFMNRYKNTLLFIHALGLILFVFLVFPLTEILAENSIYWYYIQNLPNRQSSSLICRN